MVAVQTPHRNPVADLLFSSVWGWLI